MRFDGTPVLDPRTAADLVAELRRRRPAFLPEWQPADHSAGDALMQIAARYGQVVIDRLNQAPDRNCLAFLDMLGIGLIPGQPARAPVVFKTFPDTGDGHAPAGTRVGADVAGASSPVIFETDSGIALAGARLTDVMTVWPDRDAYADGSSDAAGGRPFSLFTPLKPIPHVLYLAHDTVFDVAKDATIMLAFDLAVPASAPIASIWEYWDGQTWQVFKPFDSADAKASQDGTGGFIRSGVVVLRLTCGRPEKTSVMGIDAIWIRARAADPLPPDPSRVFPSLDRVRARTRSTQSGLALDAAYAGAIKLDVTGTFYPFGHTTTPGEVFYLASDEAFGKPGATVGLSYAAVSGNPAGLNLFIRWQYWNGHVWRNLANVKDDAYFAAAGASVPTFTVPLDIAATEVHGEKHFWLRAQVVSGSYIIKSTLVIEGPGPTDKREVDVIQTSGPGLKSLTVSYDWRPPSQPIQHCCTYNDFQFELRTQEARAASGFFRPFSPITDATPTLYLGFDRQLPNDLVSLHLDVDESDAVRPALVWEGWDGERWRDVSASDDTMSLARPGLVSFIAPPVLPRPKASIKSASGWRVLTASALEAALFQPGQLVAVAQVDKREVVRIAAIEDHTITVETPLKERYTAGTVSLAALPRFGTPRDWVRARLKENGAPERIRVNGIHPNAAWATQRQTISGEVLGSGNGQPGQTLFFSQFPILPGEEIEVRELEGARASVELPMLRDELLAAGFSDDDIRTVVDPRTAKIREVWVRWRSRPHLYFSSPTDRHYVVERARGRLLLGDNTNGRLATVGVDNIRARTYRAARGQVGNVARGAITQMLGGAFAESVSNPHAASGGADGELPDAVRRRGPQTLRHRWRALAARDYESLSREASPGVAAVRVLPATAPNRRPAPGWVTVIIVPQSQEARPQPSLELRQHIHDYLAARAPATLRAPRIAVIGPTYRPVGVAALIAPRVAGDAGPVVARVQAALATFLHPLTGGPEGRGWDFGRDVFISDVAAILEALPGVDYVRQLDLLLDDAPVGTRVPIPTDQIVVADAMRIEIQAREV